MPDWGLIDWLAIADLMRHVGVHRIPDRSPVNPRSHPAHRRRVIVRRRVAGLSYALDWLNASFAGFDVGHRP